MRENIFIEWFWPKEMRDLVDKHRAEGRLNPVAVAYFRRRVVNYFIGFPIYSFVMFGYIQDPSIFIILLIMPILIWIDIRFYFYHKVAAYSFGSKIQAKVISKNRYWNKGLRFTILKVHSIRDLKEYTFKIHGRNLSMLEMFPKVGQIVGVYIVPDKKYKPTIDIISLKVIYSLVLENNDSVDP